MKRLVLLALLIPTISLAAPFIVSDPSTDVPAPDTCTCTVGISTLLSVSPMVGNACHQDTAPIPVGPFSLTCVFSSTNPIWGNLASVPSLPLSAAKPGVPSAPKNLRPSAT